jgi:6,7-dimethyl-8-ribityllumazine synthase
MSQKIDGDLDGAGLRIGVVTARFNEFVTEALLEGARRGLRDAGVADDDIFESSVPGAFEIPFAGQCLLEERDLDAVIGLGAVIRGDTAHFDYVCQGVTQGIMQVSLDTGRPFAFGVLTVDTVAQAQERAGEGPDNKGAEAARVAVEMARMAQSARRRACGADEA